MLAIEEVDGLRLDEVRDFRSRCGSTPADEAIRARERLDKVPACETGCTGDQNWAGEFHLPLFVLSLVVRLERRIALLDRPPPPLVLLIPPHGLDETALERHLRCPSDSTKLGGIETVAAIVTGTIGDRLDQRPWLAECIQDPVREVDVHDVVAAANVVDLAIRRTIDQQVNGATVVEHVQPVTNVLAIAIERHRNVVDGIGHEERKDFLWKLIRTVVVRGPRDDDRQLIGGPIAVRQSIRSGFACLECLYKT